jgi:hypothetical protein
MYEKQYCMIAIIVVIVKTNFDHGVHLLWTSPAKKALVRNPSALTTLFVPGKSWDNVRSSAVPYAESSQLQMNV